MMTFQRTCFTAVVFFSCALASRAQFELEQAFPALTFARPVDIQHAGDGSSRLFVLEQAGLISVFSNAPTVSTKKVFLDIRARVDDSGNEEGLLGLAFHPNYAANGYFFVNYTASGASRTVVARYQVSTANADSADENSEAVVLEFSQPFDNHNGGQLAFGPDGYLYISTGDGGSGGDPQNNAQNRTSLLGKILRVDVDNPAQGIYYGIPPDNPYTGNLSGYREEIYAYGLRNPWRFSFDPVTGWLWAADVGQNEIEEVDIIEKGKNYGWRIMEGTSCYNPPTGCNTTGLTLPIWEYTHALGFSVTGGFVYRGNSVPELQGAYVYADYGSGRVWSLRYDGVNPTVNTELLDTQLNIASFGVDENNELYLSAFDGKIYRFKPTVPTSVRTRNPLPQSFVLKQNYPNPFNPRTTVEFQLETSSNVKLSVTDLLGRQVATLLDAPVQPGVHRVTIDGQRLASGIYLYRIETDTHLLVRKMLLLK